MNLQVALLYYGYVLFIICIFRPSLGHHGGENKYRGADKSLARPGRKQATATEDFDVHIPCLLS